MSVCEIMEDIRQNVDGFLKVRQVYRIISAKEITEDELNIDLDPDEQD